MSRANRLRRQVKPTPVPEAGPTPLEPAVPHAPWWLAAAFLIPNLGALACRFVFDDRVLIVENQAMHVHTLGQLAHIWKSGYWPDNRGLELYRPVAQTVWALLWAAGGGSPIPFHAFEWLLGAAVVLLLYRLLLEVRISPRVAFIAAAIFALLPVHTDATTSVTGSAELMAAALSLAALLCYYRKQPIVALVLFALAVFSKESAAAFAAVPLAFPRGERRWKATIPVACGAAAIIAASLIAHEVVSRSSLIPPIDNPAALLQAPQRVLTALWVQSLYLFKSIVPLTLSADYSYKQIRLVMGLDDWRAWPGLILLAGAVYLFIRRAEFRPAILLYTILFSPTSNVLFPIGTIMGERLLYAPSIGLALLMAILLGRTRYWKPLLIAAALLFAARTAIRNRDWLDAHSFYTKLEETSPESAKSHFSMGALFSSDGQDVPAIAEYDRAIAIFPAYAEAYRNRGNALARLGRFPEAMESYQQCLRFDPGDFAANNNLRELMAGHTINPPRAHL